jgi:uncharacterized protein (TIGR02996 family)
MQNEAAFLQAVLAQPEDDTLRLAYADWLEEQGDAVSAAKAEFLRLTAQPGTEQQRFQQLAANLDTDWLAVVSRLPIENCGKKQQEADVGEVSVVESMGGISFHFLCDKRWEDLQVTGDRAARFCDACRQNVHYCDTIQQARKHAWAGHCIAVDLGVIRREGDLERPRMFMGRISAEFLREEDERMQPDPVSAERERRKQGKRRKGRKA